jgi:Tol biopolymer transport system component/DNA-binding winged helix-turn-helix (wHTH) protein
MSSEPISPTVISFGPFEVDLRTQELKKHGVRLRLPGQSFQILAMLLRQPGQLVAREELQQALWPADTHVDFERGVNVAVNRLRDVMGDSADSPHLIETLPRRGYRFIGNVDVPSIAKASGEASFTKVKGMPWILAGASCLLALGLFYLKFPHLVKVKETFEPIPFTAYAGIEGCPTFSPDGSQIAFSWNGDPESTSNGFDLYVKVIGTENLLRLTHRPSGAICPAWSPDGTQIAFYRRSGDKTGVYVVPALGGPERTLLSADAPAAISGPISWSPDGKWIVYSKASPGNFQRLELLSVETLESKQVPHAEDCRDEGMPAFAHSVEQLAYTCLLKTQDNEFGIYSSGIFGDRPRLVTRINTGWNVPIGMTWTSDDKRLILARPHTGDDFELNEVTLANGSIRKLALGLNLFGPATSARGGKLAYVATFSHVDIWRKDLSHPEATAVKLISSTRDQSSPQYSPDGKHIAFASNRSGTFAIWMSDGDGTHLVQISDFKSSEAGSPHWSPDSQKIAFDSRHSGHPEVYVVDLLHRMPRKVATNLEDMSTPSWSRDGKWLYFQSGSAGKSGSKIFRCPVGGGLAIAVSAESGSYALEGFDGDTVYFANRRESATIQKTSLRTAPGQSMLGGMPVIDDHSCWTIVSGGIYFVPATNLKSIQYFDFITNQVRQVFTTEKSFVNGLSVSTDGRWILYTQEEGNTDIMLVNRFE